MSTTPSNQYAVVDAANDNTTVTTGPAVLVGIVINTALSAQALPILDGVGGTAVITLPASAAAGQFFDCYSVTFKIGIYVDPNDAATGNLTLVYRQFPKTPALVA